MKEQDELEKLRKENAQLKGDIYRLQGYYEHLKHNMNNQLGYQFSKQMIDHSEIEFAIEQTNKKLEQRDW